MTRLKARNVVLVLLGVAGLLLKRHYAGPFEDIVQSYAGNVSASFAVYFIVRITTLGWKSGALLAAAAALMAVELFEATDGFGVMSNTYDPGDFIANVLGIAVALAVDMLSSPRVRTASAA